MGDGLPSSTTSPIASPSPLSQEERRAIEVHKWYLSQREDRDVGWDAALEDWVRTQQASWRALFRRRQHTDNQAQAQEIRNHVWIESERAGTDVSRQAIADWVQRYAAEWRAHAAGRHAGVSSGAAISLRVVEMPQRGRESGEAWPREAEGGARWRSITVAIERGLHVRPSMALKRLLDRLTGCTVYVRNCTAGGEALRVTEMMDLLSLGAICGDVLEFGVVGPDADAALQAIEELFAQLACGAA